MAKLDKIKKWMAKGTIVTGTYISGGTKKGKIARIDESDATVRLESGEWFRFKGLKKFREAVEEPPAAHEIKAGDYVHILSTDFEGNGDVPKHVGVGDVRCVADVKPGDVRPVKIAATESVVGYWSFPFSAVEKCDGPAKPEPKFKTGDRARLISKKGGALYGFDIGDIVTIDSISPGSAFPIRVTKNGPMPGGPGLCSESALEKIDGEAPPAAHEIKAGDYVRILSTDFEGNGSAPRYVKVGEVRRVVEVKPTDRLPVKVCARLGAVDGRWSFPFSAVEKCDAPTKPRPAVGDLVRYVGDDTGHDFEGLGVVVKDDRTDAPFLVQAIYAAPGRETAWHRKDRIERIERVEV